MLSLRPGCVLVSDQPEEIRAVIGSGILIVAHRESPPLTIAAYCTEPRLQGRAIQNHRQGFPFVDFTFEWILNQFAMQGTKRRDIVFKVFGGAGGARRKMDTDNIGAANLDSLRTMMVEQGVEASAFDLGGEWGRELILVPDTAEVRLRRLKRRTGEQGAG